MNIQNLSKDSLYILFIRTSLSYENANKTWEAIIKYLKEETPVIGVSFEEKILKLEEFNDDIFIDFLELLPGFSKEDLNWMRLQVLYTIIFNNCILDTFKDGIKYCIIGNYYTPQLEKYAAKYILPTKGEIYVVRKLFDNIYDKTRINK